MRPNFPCFVLVVALLAPAMSFASGFVSVQGVLRSAGGSVAPDGNYTLIIRLYDSETATKELWKEAEFAVPVKGGAFGLSLGTADPAAPLPADIFNKNQEVWVGVQIPPDVEFPRAPFGSVPYAFAANTALVADKAGLALNLDCVGCVKSQAIDFAYAGSTSKGGAAIDLECAGCVGAADLTNGAVGDAALGVNYAGSDTKGGAAQKAAQADTAQAALQADAALVADLAKSLQCTGCVSYDMLAADVAQKLQAPATTSALGGVIVGKHLVVNSDGLLDVAEDFLALSGGKVTGPLELAGATTISGAVAFKGTVDFGGAQAGLFRLQNAAKPPVTCDAARTGMLYFDTAAAAFMGCDGTAWIALAKSCALGACAEKPATSCAALLTAAPGSASGAYWLSPKGGAAFQAWCDMTTSGGGWTMCYTTSGEVHIKTENKFTGTYGQNGYRTNCNDVPFNQLIYINHTGSQIAAFSHDDGKTLTASGTNYFVSGSTYGTWSAIDGVATKNYKYQLNVCDAGWMWTGFMMTGATGCWKDCNGWCGDTSSVYFRTDGDDSSSYNGVAFNENGHTNVSTKLLSVGIR